MADLFRVYSQVEGESEDEMLARASAHLGEVEMREFYALYPLDMSGSEPLAVFARLDPAADEADRREREGDGNFVVISRQGGSIAYMTPGARVTAAAAILISHGRSAEG